MFSYEMHLHTRPCSGGGDEIGNHIEALRKKGFSGAVVTNHFFRGDTKIDRSLPWADFVDAYAEDYEKGKKIARLYDFDLLFGIEEHILNGKEYLVYGITPDVLYRHPELKNAPLAEFVGILHREGGLVFQAHPYRRRWYIAEPGVTEEYPLLDGIEVYNAGNTPEENAEAAAFLAVHPMRAIAGSDAHESLKAGRAGILSTVRIRTEKELVSLLLSGQYKLLL